MTTAAISLPVPPPPAPEVLAPESDSVVRMDQELRAAATAYRKSLARIAYFGFRLRLCEGWRAWGFPGGTEGENLYRESLEIPRSSWFKAVRIGQALSQLTLEELEAIRPTNLELLIQVHPAIYHDYSWVKEARLLRPKKFAELVAERNREVGDDREPMASFSVRIPFLAKQSIETMVEDFRKKHQLSSPGQALEFLIAEKHDSPSLLSAADQARRLLNGVLETIQRNSRLNVEATEWIRLAKETLDEACAQAVQASRQEAEGGEEAGGRA